MGFVEGDEPEARGYCRDTISLPLYPGLAEVEQGIVVDSYGRSWSMDAPRRD